MCIRDRLEGASPLICRELSYRIAPGDPTVSALSPVQRATVSAVLGEWAAALAPGGGTPLLLGGEKPDFTFLPQRQYEGTNITQTPYPTCSELLEEFYRLKTGRDVYKRQSIQRSCHHIIVGKLDKGMGHFFDGSFIAGLAEKNGPDGDKSHNDGKAQQKMLEQIVVFGIGKRCV